MEAEGITVHDLDLVVQSTLTGGDFINGNSYFMGDRVFADDLQVPIVTISHHLAHAYSTIGRCPFQESFDILIIDGAGSSFNECIDLGSAFIPEVEKIHRDVARFSNRRGMPIAETPQDALEFFFSSKLDHLVMDKFIVSK